ncbi:cancer-associated gene 1 protein-like [Photinus pyralis]|uniref:cancer-associated gene 1 protein-like n=1 Tax=Photinus pyralis TaxID=7054 RepID=UPI0012675BE7|nr:cancer-associated gene 1 protein-like [Photinus pyralis]
MSFPRVSACNSPKLLECGISVEVYMEHLKKSTLAEDLSDLENDFKHNLNLLRLKDLEIQRCSVANKTLQESLTARLAEIDELNQSVIKLESALQMSELRRDDEKQICKQTVSSLTKTLDDVQRGMNRRLEELRSEYDEKVEKLELHHKNVLEERDRDGRQKIRNLEDRLERAIVARSKGENQLQSLKEENMKLRNQLGQIESEHYSQRFATKKQITDLENINSNLNKEIESTKMRYENAEREVEKLKCENDILNGEIITNREKVYNLITQSKIAVSENARLKAEGLEKEKLHKGLLANNERLESDRRELELECDELRAVIKENSNPHCREPSHSNFDFVLKQNVVLKELVKQMKKEKEDLNMYNREAEDRINKLEDLMNTLKKKLCVEQTN